MRDEILVRKVRELNLHGWSYSALSEKFGKHSSTISRWCGGDFSNVPDNPTALYYYNKRISYLNLEKVNFELSKEKARFYAALLYWCEGSKYPSSNSLAFTSSDVNMQVTFIKLLRIGFNLREAKFKVWLQIHDDQNDEELLQFWSERLRVPVSQFLPTHINRKKGGRYRKDYCGTCSVRYGDYSLILRLMGIFKRFSEFVVESEMI